MRGANCDSGKRRLISSNGGWARRHEARGLTLIELMVVITIIGLLSAAIAVGVWVLDKRARIKTAGIACDSIRGQVGMFRDDHPDSDCPTVDQLKTDGLLDHTFDSRDPWGKPYRLECDPPPVACLSMGPDRQDRTDDDIVRGR